MVTPIDMSRVRSVEQAVFALCQTAVDHAGMHHDEYRTLGELTRSGMRGDRKAERQAKREQQRLENQLRATLVSAAGVPWWVRLLPLAAKLLPVPWNFVLAAIAQIVTEVMKNPEGFAP